jgi:hypothetical protein
MSAAPSSSKTSTTLWNPCVNLLTTVAATGTISGSGAVDLNGSLGGGTARIDFSAPTATTRYVDATITITGGSCALPATPSLARFVPNISGTYGATVTVMKSAEPDEVVGTGTATLTLAQLNSPNPTGQFAVSGTLVFTSSVRTTTAQLNGEIGGFYFELTSPNSQNPPHANVELEGDAYPGIPTAGVSIGDVYNAGSCSGDIVTGQLLPK